MGRGCLFCTFTQTSVFYPQKDIMKFTAVAVCVAVFVTVASASCVDLSESTECPDWEVSIPFPGGSVAGFDANVKSVASTYMDSIFGIACPSVKISDYDAPNFKRFFAIIP
jgi:hypothetical protein